MDTSGTLALSGIDQRHISTDVTYAVPPSPPTLQNVSGWLSPIETTATRGIRDADSSRLTLINNKTIAGGA